MNRTFWKNDWFIGLSLMLLFLILANTPAIRQLDWFAYDLGVRLSAGKPVTEDVVIIAVDDDSLQRYGAWPWPRNLLAQATKQIARARPRVIGFNIPFDIEQNSQSRDQLEKLKKALEQAKAMRGNVKKEFRAIQSEMLADQVLASRFRTSGRIVLLMPYAADLDDLDEEAAGTSILPEYLHKFALRKTANGEQQASFPQWLDDAPVATTIYPPVEPLVQQVGAVGVIAYGDHDDGLGRREALIVRYGEHYLPSFALMLAARYRGMITSQIKLKKGEHVKIGETSLATDKQVHIYPRYYRNQNGDQAIRSYSISRLIEGELSAAALRDKIVIIGITARQHVAQIDTPIGLTLSPTHLVAHSVTSILGNELYRSPGWTGLAQAVAIIVVGLYLMFLLPGLRGSTGLMVSLLIAFLAVNLQLYLMIVESTWLPLMAAILLLFVGHALIGLKQLIGVKVESTYQELSEANFQLGLAFQSQGQLDQAFDKFRRCRGDHKTFEQLYNLGLDYERRRQFNKAVKLFEFIDSKKRGFRDVARRLQHNLEASNAVLLSSGGNGSAQRQILLDKSGLEKPMLGRYQVDSEIGKGSMGTVYLAHDPKIGRTVAIKTLALTSEFENEELAQVKSRFFREAEAAGRLNHSNIVTVYDIGEDQDLSYIAMDYLKGKDLSWYCKKEELLPIHEVLSIGMHVARALDYAHSQHVVHRDIKPANIIYDEVTGAPTVTDFGVACLTDSSKTKTGTVLGSPYYMSPEQLAGNKVDGRSDLYSLGVTLYQMLSGELPFKGDSMANLMYRITNEKPMDVRVLRPELSDCIARIINKALHKDAAKRYQCGKQMAASIKRCNNKLAANQD